MTRRQAQLSKEIREALRAAGFEATKVTTGWRPRRGGTATRHSGFKLTPEQDGDSIRITFVHSMLLAWQHLGRATQLDFARRQLSWLNKYQPVLEAAGFQLVTLHNEPFERPYAVWKRNSGAQEQQERKA